MVTLCVDLGYEKSWSISCDGYGAEEKGHVLPALSDDESHCIRQTSCNDLAPTGVCERAKAARARGKGSYHSTSNGGESKTYGSDLPAVCP